MTGFGDPAAFIQSLLLKIPALLFAVTIHEFAHGIVADRLGDPTARRMGRLTLNPLPHIDPFGALAFVIAGFGWAKPVPVNANNLRHPIRDMSLVAAAGPVSNFIVAFLGLVTLVLHRRIGGLPGIGEPVDGMLFYLFQFNLALAIFNLIPLPPLDGGHFLPYLLPGASWKTIHQLEQYGPMVLLLLVVTGATGYIIGPIFGVVSGFYVWLVRLIL
ncbi:MAG TPA: site-2 protease family protein [Methylomirabilota bacterium]|jgi:Zn-dependent protease|nr:site-2 protease family protein [Methylomirabilota bacterium]